MGTHSPLSDQNENPNNYQEYTEYVEPSWEPSTHPDLLAKMTEHYKQNYDDTASICSKNSYAELDSDCNTIILSDTDTDTEEISDAPPPKTFKGNHSPSMFCNLLSSNFFYHQSN